MVKLFKISYMLNRIIDYKDYVLYFWKRKHFIALVILLFWACTFIYFRSLPSLYCSEILLAPNTDEKYSSIAIKDHFGGHVLFSDINMGLNRGITKSDVALEILKTRKFIYSFLKKRVLMPILLNGYKEEFRNNNLKPISDESHSRLYQRAYCKFLNMMIVTVDYKTRMVQIGIEHNVPEIANQIVNWLVEDINIYLRESDKLEALDAISALYSISKNNNNLTVQNFVNQLIEEKTKTLMFVNIRLDYAFKVIDPAIISENISKPKIILNSCLSAILGFILSVFFLMIKISCEK